MSEGGEHQRDGRLVGGRYRLIERIGSGGTGTVWRALDERADREVAVKQPRLPGDPGDESHRRAAHRFRREARAAARVDHPSAVAIHDVVVEPEGPGGVVGPEDVLDELPWAVMELVRGESLRETLRRGPLPVRETARIGRAVLGALRAAHAVGIVHRDVKPANVLLGPDGRVVLTDFGTAHVPGEESPGADGEFTGELEFVAPERMSGRIAGPASDLWSLGVVLYAAVEGFSPFRRTTPEATLDAILAADPPEPRQAGPLGPLLVRLLAKDPERRPGAEEADAVLDAVAEGRPVPGPAEHSAPRPHAAGSGTTRQPDTAREPGTQGPDTTLAPPAQAQPPALPTAPAPAPPTAPAPASPPEPAVPPTPEPASPHRILRHPASMALLGVLLTGGVWLTTSSFLLEPGSRSGRTEQTATHSQAPGGATGTPEPRRAPAAASAPASAPSPSSWTAHREKDMDAVLSVPDGYQETARQGSARHQPRVVIYAKDAIHVRLTQWDRAPRSPLAQAEQAHRIRDGHQGDARTRYTRTSVQGYEAVLADTTYDLRRAPARVMELMIRTDDSRMYQLRVDMPKGTPEEKKGTAVFQGARDRLRIGTR
ncbi:serine/threonine-protein kinase [Streptomyces sp. NPDC052682]|uniref:serine/threonine-protein kinase n=1 Tax=Streptomyces sp. NPDC052682 TaxID=3154954 RepID=UPI0034181B39